MTLAICLPCRKGGLGSLDTTGIKNLLDLSAKDILTLTGENVGNLGFLYGFRRLVAEDVIEVSSDCDPADIRRRARALLLPCANLVNPEYDYGTMAAFVEAIDLPTLALGIGSQSHGLGDAFDIPDGTKRFLRAISARSAGFGVRGDYTKSLIEGYGVSGARTLGCPSFLINPDKHLWQRISDRAAHVSSGQLAVMEGTYPRRWHSSPELLVEVERRLFAEVVNGGADYVSQASHFVFEFALGRGYLITDSQLEGHRKRLAPTLSLVTFRSLMSQRARGNYRVDHWLNNSMRYSGVIGTRIHGAILALQAGTPAMLITHDGRTAELASTLRLPTISAEDAKVSKSLTGEFERITSAAARELDEHRTQLARKVAELLAEMDIKPSTSLVDLCRTSLTDGVSVQLQDPEPVRVELSVAKPSDAGSDAITMSICLPTNRGFDLAIPAIQRLLAQDLPPGVELVISDNSLDAQKGSALRSIAARKQRVKVLIHESSIPANENFIAALTASSGELVAFCTDDDVVYPEYFSYAKSFLEKHPSYSCAAGAICYYAAKGPRIFMEKEYTGNWDKRVLDYLFVNTTVANLLFYGVYRRSFVLDFFDYLNVHPLVDSFFDFHLPVWALSNGEGHIGAKGLLIYDDCNWGDVASRLATRSRHYEKIGLPGWFSHFHDLYRAVEYYLFLAGGFSDKPAGEKKKIGLEISGRYLRMWWSAFAAVKQDVPASVLLGVEQRMANGLPGLGILDVIDLFFYVLRGANEELSRKYHEFFTANIDI